MSSEITSINTEQKNENVSVQTLKRSASATQPQKLSRKELLGYCAPTIAVYFIFGPMQSVIQGVYVKYYGFELTAMAAIMVLARLFDGIIDPVVGYLTDRHANKGGSRRPWIFSGGILLVISAYFLFSPPHEVSFLSTLFWFLVFYLALTLFDMPHISWGSLLAPEYQQRNQLYAYRTSFLFIGTFAFLGLPLLPFFQNHEYSPDVLRTGVYIGGGLMFLTLLFFHRNAPERSPQPQQHDETVLQTLKAITNNKPLCLFLGAFLVNGLGIGMWMGLLFIYLDSYLHLGKYVAVTFVLGYMVGMATIPLWQCVNRRFSKFPTWSACLIVFALLSFCYLVVKPESGPWWPILITVGMFSSFTYLGVVLPSIMADIVDYGELKFGRDRSNVYFACWSLISKANMGIGAGLGLGLAGLLGFDPTPTAINNENAIWGLLTAFALAPALLSLCTLAFVSRMAITPQRHAIIRKRIESLRARKAVGV